MTSPTSTSRRRPGGRPWEPASQARGLTRSGLRSRVGFTLIELVIVMLLISLLLGAGVGLLAGFSPARGAASGMVRNLLRSAQSSAAATQSPTVVRLDREGGWLSVESMRVIGTWHFEGRRLLGAFGMDGEVRRDLFSEDGYIGDALSLGAAGGRGPRIPIEDKAGFDLGEGFLVECALRREDTGGGRVLDLGGALVLEVGQAGELRARFGTRGDGVGANGRSARVTLTSPAGMLQLGRWARVAVRYDRRQFQLEVEGLVVASFDESALVQPIEGDLELGGGGRPFPGSLDNLVISAVELGERVQLPEGSSLGNAPAAIYFQAGGGLDRRLHAAPASVELVLEDGSRDVFSVGVFGTAE